VSSNDFDGFDTTRTKFALISTEVFRMRWLMTRQTWQALVSG
jgi:hypothetical protein